MSAFEELCRITGYENVQVLVGSGYTKVIYAGLDVIEWLIDPNDLEHCEYDEQENPC